MKLDMLITVMEHMYTWDERAFAEAEQLRREAAKFLGDHFVYECEIFVSYNCVVFPTFMVHHAQAYYVVKLPSATDDEMPIRLRQRIIDENPGSVGPFNTPNEIEPIEDCITIQKTDNKWKVEKAEESEEE